MLESEVRNIENRWKSGTLEPYKITPKGIISQLHLKSINEINTHKVLTAF